MNRSLGVKLLLVTIAAALPVGAVGTSLALAQEASAPIPKCLNDPKAAVYLLGHGYFRGGKLVGNSVCDDGATATATTGGQSYSFKGGACFREGDVFTVQVGTYVSFKRVKVDPPGFKVDDVAPGGPVKDGAWFGYTKRGKVVDWGIGDVKLAVTRGAAPKGSFSGFEPRLVNGKLTKVPASGSFRCKRVLKVPG